MEKQFSRRTFIKSTGMTLAALSGIQFTKAYAALNSSEESLKVPWSSGTGLARTKVPLHATDCHHHIYDSRWPIAPTAKLKPADALIADYRLLQKRIGTSRNVVVQPSTYGVDNSGLKEVLKIFGLETTRGVAVVNTEVSDAELKELHGLGVRGVRFNLATPGAVTNFSMVEPLSKRIAEFGWHLQINGTAQQIFDGADLWNKIPCQVVFDHLGHLPEPEGIKHPAFKVMVELMQKRKGWVKLTGVYNDTKVGAPTYADSGAIVKALVKAAPNQLVWGSDWPHPTEAVDNKPDDALLLDLLAEWVPNEVIRNRILVNNPARLYGFPL